MTRRCSHCSNNGHNSRTCPNRGLKLFGVRITDGSIRKSASMGNLTHYTGSGSGGGAFNSLSGGGGGTDLDSPGDTPDHNAAADGYGSEDFVAGSSSGRERKKGVPWTEEEHRMFLLGLQKLGKGDWRGIARNYVISRTPTQVASHAQKYFIRQTNMSRRKRRSSLFDMVPDDPLDAGMNMMGSQSHDGETQSVDNPKVRVPTVEEKEEVEEEEEEEVDDDDECESMDSASSNIVEPGMKLVQEAHYCYPAAMFPAYYEFIPVAIPFWGGPAPAKTESHEVLKPTAVHSKTPINVDQLVGLSKLSLGDSIGDAGPNSLKLLGSLSRQSAFHASSSSSSSSENNNNNNNNTNPRTSSGSMAAHSCTVGG
ncbi:unnamed protein product [Lactuca saligna]|uniref:Uncharacterized protein n=1 Tax=Lactuca saligna TaxID=75948 RepID=A0AA36DWM9_LACSI|nr:unnamed protein product [Lactuca saligna]